MAFLALLKGGNPWTGLHSDDNGVTWQWTDGTPVDYLHWNYGEPTIYVGQNCVLIDNNTDEDTWFRVWDCGDTWHPVCKKPH